MSAHELALQKALVAHLKGDAAVQALLGAPARIWDAPPEGPGFPHLLIGRTESRPVRADGGGVEHALTLTVVSRFRGGGQRGRPHGHGRPRPALVAVTSEGGRAG